MTQLSNDDAARIVSRLGGGHAPGPADEVLQALDLDPERYRTEGGAINRNKLRATIKHPQDYLPADHWLNATADPVARQTATPQLPVEVLCYWRNGRCERLEFEAWPQREDLPDDAVRFDIAWPDPEQ